MDNNNTFLDKNTLIAIAISFLFFIGWQQYVDKKYPNAKKPVEQAKVVNESSDESSASATTVDKSVETSAPELKAVAQSKQSLPVQLETMNFTLSSLGMGLEDLQLALYSDREDHPIKFAGEVMGASNLATFFNGQPVAFNIEKKSENEFVGQASVGEQVLEKTMRFNPQTYTVSIEIKTISGQVAVSDKIDTLIVHPYKEEDAPFFAPSYEGTEFFTIHEGEEDRQRLSSKDPVQQSYKQASLLSIGTQYFAIAAKDSSPITPLARLEYNPQKGFAEAWLTHDARTNGQITDVQMTAFLGPKKYDLLSGIDNEFTRLINYGIFSFLCKPILLLLKWIYSIIQNWGLAIIFLTLVVRLLLLPINISSMKSMKRMQKIQPQLKSLREKFKDDPQRMNMETMALMKREKANPLGGCLPMLLQLPVFFALYSVIGQSVELYKSPFAFWIQDLSAKDPFFVLPIAVGALYFLQMNITPQPTMDPNQAKMMKFIPIVFSFFMIAVPSGLTLYILVSTVFGIGQSLIFQRERNKVSV